VNIYVEPSVMRDLETFANQVGRSEFSGIGFCTRADDRLSVYDAVILDVGSSVETNIKPDQLLELGKREDAQNGRVWIHLHPVGNGMPGPHNWSGTDERSIQTCPLGGIPQVVKWSASIVRTPRGWVGRIDNHITHKTAHVEVLGQASRELYASADELLQSYLEKTSWMTPQFEDLRLGRFEDDLALDLDELLPHGRKQSRQSKTLSNMRSVLRKRGYKP
jgi:hypothetical protein